MTRRRRSLNERSMAALPFVPARQEIVRDADLSGFFVVVGTGTISQLRGESWLASFV